MCLIQGRSQQDKHGPPYLRKNRFAYMVQSVLLKNRRRPKIPETVSLNTAWPGPRIPDQTDDAKLKRFKVYQFYFRQRLYGPKKSPTTCAIMWRVSLKYGGQGSTKCGRAQHWELRNFIRHSLKPSQEKIRPVGLVLKTRPGPTHNITRHINHKLWCGK